MMLACHAGDPGSIPGSCIRFATWTNRTPAASRFPCIPGSCIRFAFFWVDSTPDNPGRTARLRRAGPPAFPAVASVLPFFGWIAPLTTLGRTPDHYP
eukprot:scaffold3446_cov69-Phaeocystis_antarctica.AAC.1